MKIAHITYHYQPIVGGIDDLVKCVKEASSKSPEWCKNASELTIKNYQENCSVVGFRNKFNELVRKVTNEWNYY